MPTESECDYVVKTASQLVSRIQENGVSIYISQEPDVIDLSDVANVWMGSDITLVGGFCDPAIAGRGTYLRVEDAHPRTVFRSRSGAKLYGVPFKGPETEYFDPREKDRYDQYEDWFSSGFFIYPENAAVVIHGCEFWGWTLSGVELGARNVETNARVVRCSFHDSPMETAGYGIEHYNGVVNAEYCFFDTSRHGISGFGHRGEEIHVRSSVFGPGPWSGHTLDMHGLDANIDGADHVAGRQITAKNCTFMGTRDVGGYDQEGLAIRGIPEEMSRSDKNHWFHDSKPTPPGEQGDAYRQEVEDDWKNFDPGESKFGPEIKNGFGAPRANEEDDSMQLAIHGRGTSGRYQIWVDGTVTPTSDIEGNDSITDDGLTKIDGGIIGSTDTYELSDGATVERAWFSAPARVTLNGEPIDTGPLVAIEAQRRMDAMEQNILGTIQETFRNITFGDNG